MTAKGTESALVPIVMPVPAVDIVKRKLIAIQDFQALCRHELKQGQDYGVIPGTDKPTLLKPGAEKIVGLLGLDDDYEVISQIEDWDRGLFSYTVRCVLADLATGARRTGLGECNSMESKYRWRWAWPRDLEQEGIEVSGLKTRTVNTRNGPVKQYRLPNDDPYSLKNTILKMAKKRALVDAALSAGRLSDIFTQDLDERESPLPSASGAERPNPKPTPAKGNRNSDRTEVDEGQAPESLTTWGDFAAVASRRFRHPWLKLVRDLGVQSPAELGNTQEARNQAWATLIDLYEPQAAPELKPGEETPFE